VVSRGDRIGLIGPNGAGKTTLVKLILGTLAPDAGSVRLGANVQPAYFDQLREALDPEKTVAETISPGSEWVESAGGRKHVMSYLGDFLFPPRRAASPVRMLSGGERNRLLLARLFAEPANVLVLDEPDQRPRHRVARAARGGAAGLCRHHPPRVARPRVPRQRRHPDARRRGRRRVARVRGGILRLRAPASRFRCRPPDKGVAKRS
jgi:ABC-type branched-subunit amino acid transport system ATPase component